MLAAIINAYSLLADRLLSALSPAGPVSFWLCSLVAIACLMLFGARERADTRDDADLLPGRVAWVLVTGVTILGAALRFYGRDALPFWWDELLAVWIAHADLPTLLRTLATPAAPASDFTPPLFYLLLHAWQTFFGPGEGPSRFLTAAFSSLTIPAAYLLVRRLAGTSTALCATFLLAVSGSAVYYAQQVRCYALLALLAVLFLLAAEAAGRRLTPWRAVALIVCGVLFLHTHFVAVWLYAPLCAAYVLLTVRRSDLLAEPVRAVTEAFGRARFPALVAAGFLLAAVCPLFLPAGGMVSPGALVWAGLTLLVLLLLAELGEIRETPASTRQNLTFLAVLAIPGLSFLPWLLTTRIWEVIANQGAKVSGAYGLKDMGNAIDTFCGLDMAYTPYLLGLGFFSLLARRPRTALLVAAWTVVPMAMAMYVQNQNMQLVRYLFLTQAGYLLLLAAAIVETLTWPVAGVRQLAARVLPGRPIPRQLLPLAAFCVVVALFGFTAFNRISFPTRVVDVENYPLAASDLAGRGHVCPGFPSRNLSRAIGWYLERQGTRETTCTAGDDRVFLLNTDYEGHPWSDQASQAAWLAEHGTPGPLYPRLRPFTVSPAALSAPKIANHTAVADLDGRELFLAMRQGHDIAYAGGMLHPLFKEKAATADVVLAMPPLRAGKATVSLSGVVAGPKSYIRLTLSATGQETPPAVMTVRGDGSPRGGLSLVGTANAGSCAMREGTAVCVFPVPAFGPAHPLTLGIELFDDGSGAIYSSEAGLKAVALRLEASGS